METEEQRIRKGDLQLWQEEVLRMEGIGGYFLEPQQALMIEKVLESEDFYIIPKYEGILRRVLMWSSYGEEDRVALNYVRDCYLKGKNFIK